MPIRYDIKGDPNGSGEGSPDADPRTAWSTLDMAQSTSLRALECDEMRFDGDTPRKVSCGQRIAKTP